MAEFVHLHLHSEFSLLDGLGKIDQYVARAVEYGMPAAALTDHGVLYGALDWYKACRAKGVKPIIGVEGYFTPTGVEQRDKHQHHLLLLARNEAGYRNLLWLASMASLKGFYYKPRIDRAMLAEHHEGLVALTACLGGEVPGHLMAGDERQALTSLGEMTDIFGKEHVFLELMDHGMTEQHQVNAGLLRLQKQTGLPLVATNDVHYVDRGDAHAQDVLVCIQTGVSVHDTKRMKMASDQLFFKRPDEMAATFAAVPEALANTLRVAEMCDLKLEHSGYHLPHFPVPEGFTESSYLEHVCRRGCLDRYGALTEVVERRLVYELSVIDQMGFVPYFLVVWDFVRFARERGILVGPGRGSAAGSLVAYALGITGLDPIKHNLIFERFLNLGRREMPDIDLDFQDDRRDEVIRYVTEKYGSDRVAQIITFGTLAAKAAVRDVGRALGMSFGNVDRVARLVPSGPHVSLDQTMRLPEVQQLYAADGTIRELLDTAKKLEGVARHASTHAAGVVISDAPLMEYVPVQRAGKSGNDVTTQYHQKLLEELGLLKMDFLGLSTLTIVGRACDYIRQTTGQEVTPETIPLDDPASYEVFQRGETLAIFQLEGGMATRMTVDVRPTGFDDVVALMALVRPGPMELAPVFVARKHGREPIEYLHPALEPILRATHGVILYQEQVMQIANELAGFTLTDADKLRKAMGKKLPEEMAKQRSTFVDGCVAKSAAGELTPPMTAEEAGQLFDLIDRFAGYGFNRCCHAKTYVYLPDGARMHISQAWARQPKEILAMWPDDEIRPHRVERVVKTGKKALLEVRTRSGYVIRATPEHRLLTTGGYQPISEMAIGTELIVAPRRVTEAQRQARRANITRLNRMVEQRERVSARVKHYQASRPMADKIEHMKRMHRLYPNLNRNSVRAMHERTRWLYANDPEWRRQKMEKTLATVRAAYDSGPGYGHCSLASNGMWCASRPERDMCEWLIGQGIDFEMHKVLPNGRLCDFYFAGIYWEMDGMDRVSRYFADKYGDLPYVVVTPEDFKPIVAHHLSLAHARNGDPIVSIAPCGEAETYDIEMASDGPKNFIANRIVSHNSHSAAYAVIGVQTAYLKRHYPAEFMAAVLTTEAGNTDKIIGAVAECRRLGIPVLPPDVNLSQRGFGVERADDGRLAIRYGLGAIKNVGEGVVLAILAAREREPEGRFGGLDRLCAAVDGGALNKRVLESLIKACACDGLGPRAALLAAVDRAMALGQAAQRAAKVGQLGLFGAVEETPTLGLTLEEAPPLPERTLLAWEKEHLGISVSAHPLARLRRPGQEQASLALLTPETAGQTVRLVALIKSVRKLVTKRQQTMAVVVIEDMDAEAELVLFPECYERYGEALIDDGIVSISAKVEVRNEQIQLVAEAVTLHDPEAEAGAPRQRLVVTLPRTADMQRDLDAMHQVREILWAHEGDAEIWLRVPTAGGATTLRPITRGVEPSPTLLADLERLLGPAAVRVETPTPTGPSAAVA